MVIGVYVVRMKGKQSWQDPGPAWFAQAVVQANEGKIGDWGERVKLQYAIRSNETSDFTASHIGTKDVRKRKPEDPLVAGLRGLQLQSCWDRDERDDV